MGSYASQQLWEYFLFSPLVIVFNGISIEPFIASVPFFSRLLRRFVLSSSFSSSGCLLDSDEVSRLICLFKVAAAPSPDRSSGVSMPVLGEWNRLGSGVELLTPSWLPRLTLVKPELTALKLPEDGAGGASAMGVSRSGSLFKPFCRTSDAWRAGELSLVLVGELR